MGSLASPETQPGRTASAVLVGAGGALGAVARYGIGVVLTTTSGAFPWGTFVTNCSGSLGLGVLVVLVLERAYPRERLRAAMRLLLGVGFLGAYTTYSTYAVEVDTSIHDGHPVIAVIYAGASLVAGLGAAFAGMVVTRRLCGLRRPEPRAGDVP